MRVVLEQPLVLLAHRINQLPRQLPARNDPALFVVLRQLARRKVFLIRYHRHSVIDPTTGIETTGFTVILAATTLEC